MEKGAPRLLKGMYVVGGQQAGVAAGDLSGLPVQQVQAFPLQNIEKFNKIVAVCPRILIFENDVCVDRSVV